jgi:dTMP kinase
MKRGAFILFEGTDRSGKTTQATMLVETLRNVYGMNVELWHYPDRTTPTGKMLHAYLQSITNLDDHVVHLLFSANRWEKRNEMETKLMNGTSIVVDRYVYSGIACSSAKGLDIEWCKSSDEGLFRPDTVLYMDVPIEQTEKRGGFGAERYETTTFQGKVREKFIAIRETWWNIVDAVGTVEQVHARCVSIAMETIENLSGLNLLRI